MRFREVQFRWSEFNKKYELVRWYKDCNDKELCYVVAFFDETKEGYDMRTVGDRFFEDKDAFIFFIRYKRFQFDLDVITVRPRDLRWYKEHK